MHPAPQPVISDWEPRCSSHSWQKLICLKLGNSFRFGGGFSPPPLKLFCSLIEDKVWCPVRALRWYLDGTKSLRKDDSFFVSSKELHANVSSSTIPKWLVEVFEAAGIDALKIEHHPRAHDVRGIAASWALFEGVPTSDSLRAAFWLRLLHYVLLLVWHGQRRGAFRSDLTPGRLK